LTTSSDNRRAGIGFVLAAYVAWGILPFYWKAIKSIPPENILTFRVFLSFLLLAVVVMLGGRAGEFRAAFASRRSRLWTLLTAVVIGSNFFVYVWAVNTDHLVEASLGYFINPLVSVFLGVVFLREKLDRPRLVSLGLAVAGVAFLTASFGRLPWISLVLAFSFAFYGLARKIARVDALNGLLAETAVLSPLCLGFLAFQGVQCRFFEGWNSLTFPLLLVSGLVTAVPLLWFIRGVRRIPLSTAGFIQYVSPTFQLLIGVAWYGEPFTRTHLASFGLIWAGLAVFSVSTARSLAERRNGRLSNPPRG
jgi:chloramphenicol-sensitive protein RarD